MFSRKANKDAEFQRTLAVRKKCVSKLTTQHRSLCDYLAQLKRTSTKPKLKVL